MFNSYRLLSKNRASWGALIWQWKSSEIFHCAPFPIKCMCVALRQHAIQQGVAAQILQD
jgi:hypothetical protein